MFPIKDTWIMKLFYLLQPGYRKNNIPSIFENVSFVRFNYNRCIELSLFHALFHGMGLLEEEINAFWPSLKMWHPYGSIDTIERTRPGFYDQEPSPEEISSSASRIKTYREGLEESDDLHAMREALRAGRQIVVPGYSYGRDNMALLAARGATDARIILANTYGLSVSESARARDGCARTFAAISDLPTARSLIVRTKRGAADVLNTFGGALAFGTLHQQRANVEFNEEL